MFVVAATLSLSAQQVVGVGSGSYASYVPLTESRSSLHGGCQAYQMEHRTLYLPDSLLARLGSADGSVQGTLALPSNDWWTYALVNAWTGKIWSYPGWVEAIDSKIEIGYPDHWEETGCEVKWDTPLSITFDKLESEAALVDAWSDYHMSFIMQDGAKWVRTTCVHGSPLIWIEAKGVTPHVTNPDPAKYAVFDTIVGVRHYTTIGLKTADFNEEDMRPYAYRIPRKTTIFYDYDRAHATLFTKFHVQYRDIVPTEVRGVVQGFLPHHYYDTELSFELSGSSTYMTPRGQMRLARGNYFKITYPVHTMLPFFPIPSEKLAGYDVEKMRALCADYAARGTFGADTYWGGKGLTQMMHYMTAAMQLGDTVTFRLAKQRLREHLEDWYTYTPGETERYFAYYPRWGAMVGFDTSYDSDTFNDHHFHYGYFIYASGVLCMLDADFRAKYGQMAREVARDYANWIRRPHEVGELNQPWFRTLDPYCGHSFAGGMGNGGNGNGQESTSEAMQGWGGIWMLGAALGDDDMLEAGVFGYTLESRATAEYWFDRGRRNIDYTKYKHPWCCNLTMQGVGWWTWFSGDPVWMHSIQWLPISPVLSNYLSEDRDFARWDYTEMYAKKEVGNYEADKGGLGDESGLGNVCLSYLAIFDPDSAARVWDRMDRMGKNLAKNPDTGGITYLFAHGLRDYGDQRHDIYSDYPLAAAYDKNGVITYMVFNASTQPITVRFFGAEKAVCQAPAQQLTIYRGGKNTAYPIILDDLTPVAKDPLAEAWTHMYPNIALKKSVKVSSEENAGCLAKHLTDGDLTTRWGSQHKDGEWAIVDLAAEHYIDHLILRWEPAYASEVEIALSKDKTNWQAVTFSGTGGVQRVNLAAMVMEQGAKSRARYIRLTGLKRATAYGTSLYELEAYGLPLSGDESKVIALEITSETLTLKGDEKPQYTIRGYNYQGKELPVTPTTKTNVADGVYTLTAEASGLKATYSWPILEQPLIADVVVSPREVSVPLGEEVVFTISTVDQFGYLVETRTETYLAESIGDFEQIFTSGKFRDTAMIHVSELAEMNLALRKPTTASGEENAGTLRQNVNDGELKTRWGSLHKDNEWIQIDLEHVYRINRIHLFWEAAYATSYQILVSENGKDYTTAYSTTTSKGGEQNLTIDNVPARYVKVLCLKRATGYGSSLYEVEVYGTERLADPEPEKPEIDPGTPDVEPGIMLEDPDRDLDPDPEITDIEQVMMDNTHADNVAVKFIHNQQLYILVNDGVFDAVGRRIK